MSSNSPSSASIHRRDRTRTGFWEHFKIFYWAGFESISLVSSIYYIQNYRKDLPLFQRKSIITTYALWNCRELLGQFIIQPKLTMDSATLPFIPIMVPLLYLAPIYFSKPMELKNNRIKFGVSFILTGLAHIFCSVSEIQRKWWLSKEENKGKLYTKGLFSITRHPNYFGDVLAFTGWNLLTNNNYLLLIPFFMCLNFYREFIPEIEEYLSKQFGNEWTEYTKKVKALIPFIY